jgi:hypothetical protein
MKNSSNICIKDKMLQTSSENKQRKNPKQKDEVRLCEEQVQRKNIRYFYISS